MVKLKTLTFFFSIEAKAFYVGYETDATRGAVIFYPELLCLITISPLFSGVEQFWLNTTSFES